MINCPLCLTSFTSVSFFLSHLRLNHASEAGFHITCGLQGCQRTFVNFHTYRNHVYSIHDMSAMETTSNSAGFDDIHQNDRNSISMETEMDNLMTSDHDDSGMQFQAENDQVNTTRSVAIWLLKLREMHKIPESVMSTIMTDVQDLFSHIMEALQEQSVAILHNATSINTAEDMIRELFQSQTCDIFQGLQTKAAQKSYFKSHLGLVEPKKIKLGTRRIRRGYGRKRRLLEVGDTLVYISLLKTIEIMLMDEGICTEIMKGHFSTIPERLGDLCDGTYFSSHTLFRAKPQSLQVYLYYDDVEVCNPLGSSRGKHKLAMFYFTLGNINPKMRSKLRSIQLLAICKQKLIKQYGMNKILKPFVDDIKKLENGFDVNTYSGKKKIFGSLALVVGDNPASSAIGGFKESSSAYRPCRHCMATTEEIKNQFIEDVFELREITAHEEHLDKILDDPTVTMEYGVNYRSILMDIQYFDICCGTLMSDVMHDLMEGVLQYETKLMLARFLERKYFSLENLNQQIEALELPYGKESNKPVILDRKTLNTRGSRLNQKAIQMWTLARYLPIIVGSYIPDDDDNWENFLTLLDITDYLVAPCLSTDEAAHLKFIIQDHHITFKQLYPDSSIIIKMHYLTHYPRLICKFGPLSRHWALRFEAKHHYFKNISQRIGNYINLPWTLAKRHQMWQCYQHASQKSLLETDMQVGPGQSIAIRERPPQLREYDDCYRANWIEYKGQRYMAGCIVIKPVLDEDPQFYKIREIFVVENNVVLYVGNLATVAYCRHFHAYEVKNTSQCSVVYLEELEHPYTEVIHCVSSKQYVTLRYHVSGNVM